MKKTITSLLSIWMLQSWAAQIETVTRERGVIRFPDEWKTVNGTNFNVAIIRGWDSNTGKGKRAVPFPGWDLVGGRLIANIGRGHVVELSKVQFVPNGSLPPNKTVDLTVPIFVMNAKIKDMDPRIGSYRYCQPDWALRIGEVEFEGRKIPAYDFGSPVTVKKPTATERTRTPK